MNPKTLENWLEEVVTPLKGRVEGSRYKDVLLPLVFLKRVNDVFEDELADLASRYGGLDAAEAAVDLNPSIVRLYVPSYARWNALRGKVEGLGAHLNKALRVLSRLSPHLDDIADIVDYTATTVTGERMIEDERLEAVMEALGRHRLGRDADPDILGRVYEHLLHTYARGQGQSGGEFYTPPDVTRLLALILDPKPGEEVYDPACGSGRLLLALQQHVAERYKDSGLSLRFFGQEISPASHAVARMNAFIHGMNAEIALGNTLTRPALRDSAGRLRRFDIVVGNPPWNLDVPGELYAGDVFERFRFGIPPDPSADWGWVQHMYASLKDNGRLAVVLDTGAVSRGSSNRGSHRERDIRRGFVENDLIEAVVLLPKNLFHTTSAPGIVLVVRQTKPHPGQVLLVNASELYVKSRPKNFIPDERVEQIAEVYHEWKEVDGFSRIVTVEEVAADDFNLLPSRYISEKGGGEKTPPLEEAAKKLREAEKARLEADKELEEVLRRLGAGGL